MIVILGSTGMNVIADRRIAGRPHLEPRQPAVIGSLL
jgi:hypothetical protein